MPSLISQQINFDHPTRKRRHALRARRTILYMNAKIRSPMGDDADQVAPDRIVQPGAHHHAGDLRLHLELADDFLTIMGSEPFNRQIFELLCDIGNDVGQAAHQKDNGSHDLHPVRAI